MRKSTPFHLIGKSFGKINPLAEDHDGKEHAWSKPWLDWRHDWDHGPSHHSSGHRHNHHAGGHKPSEPAQHNPRALYTTLLNEEARNVDGTGNNETNLGSAGTPLVRVASASYADGIGEPNAVVTPMGVNPRDISNAILDQDAPIPNSFGVSDLFTYFGQFIDHDIDLTPGGNAETIAFTDEDGDFAISRSGFVDGTGEESGNPREFPNVITSFVDASNIYGSNDFVTSLLRADGGTSPYLLTSEDDYAPTLGQLKSAYPDLEPDDIAALAAGGPNDALFIAGDVRANENIALTSMHTVWLREHNHQVDHLKKNMHDATDEELFQAAKLIVEAEYQNVVFNEYLPLLLGAENIDPYLGYDPSVDPGVTVEFSTAAFRLGHSQISPDLARIGEDGSDTGTIGLFQAFFNPTQLLNGGIDALVRGLGAFKGQEVDENIVDDVRNLLFGGGPPGTPIDLGVFNILRAYDHGIPTLNEVREAYGLLPLTGFDKLTSDTDLQDQFESVYTNIDNVDLWVGGLGEDNFSGSQLGETYHTIVLEQFMNFRDGDRFFFEGRMEDHPELLALIKNTSFSDILLRTTDIDYFQDDAFIAHNRIGGDDGRDTLHGTDDPDLIIGFGGKDKLYGKDGDDDLYGGKGKDKLYGNDGEDILYGGRDFDTLIGGPDADIFVIAHLDVADIITDYNFLEGDEIDLTALFTTDLDNSDGGADNKQLENFVRIITDGDDASLEVNTAGHGNNFAQAAKLQGISVSDTVRVAFHDDDGNAHSGDIVV